MAMMPLFSSDSGVWWGNSPQLDLWQNGSKKRRGGRVGKVEKGRE